MVFSAESGGEVGGEVGGRGEVGMWYATAEGPGRRMGSVPGGRGERAWSVGVDIAGGLSKGQACAGGFVLKREFLGPDFEETRFRCSRSS